MAYCKENPKTEIVALSGTMTRVSVWDYLHLIKLCCKEGCPLPLTNDLVNQWSSVLDAKAEPTPAQREQLEPLRIWAKSHFQDPKTLEPFYPTTTDGYRRAYQGRLTTAPGVVATGDSEIGVSLTIANCPVEEPEKHDGWGLLQDLMADVLEHALTPNGDEIAHAIHKYKWLWELSAGFYNELTWPSLDILAERKKILKTQAADIIQKSKAYHRLQQEYTALLREWLDGFAYTGCDTPFLVGSWMQKHGVPMAGEEMFEKWQEMNKAWSAQLIARDRKAIRVCDYKIEHAVEWAAQLGSHIRGGNYYADDKPEKGGIIWYENIEIGLWLTERLTAAGLRPLHCPAGEISNMAIVDPRNAERVVVASLNAHGQAKNLQYNWSEQLFVQWPRGASDAEQALGRTHRNGQKAEHLIVVTTNTTDFDKANFGACLNDSLYIHQTTGVRQRLIFAGYDPVPEVFPPEVLKERGFQNQMLNEIQRAMLRDKFGG